MVKVYFATNREYDKDEKGRHRFGNGFHNDSPHNLRFGWAQVRWGRRGGYVVRSVDVSDDPKLPAVDSENSPEGVVEGSKAVFGMIRAEMEKNRCEVVCVIHGYASDFETALARTAEISEKYATDGKKLIGFVFSWPSNGRMLPMLDYYSDRDDAKASGFAIARAFHLLVNFLKDLPKESYCRRSIHLLAHSMGNWALGNALDDIRELYSNAPPRLFDQVFLVAADADNNVFERGKRLARLPQICKNVNVYFSQDDRALMISDRTKFNPDRLGATGPMCRDNLDRKVVLVDCRHVDQPDQDLEDNGKEWDLSVHQYYRLRQAVVRDIQQVMSGAQPGEVKGRRYLQEDRSFQIVRPEEGSEQLSA